MVALRLHLDDCDENNGALEVWAGSHLQGIHSHPEDSGTPLSCPLSKGGIMLLSPLLLHRSPYSLSDRPRRVIHIVYTTTELPEGLEWQD